MGIRDIRAPGRYGHHRTEAFTLMELLTVMAILTVLIALLVRSIGDVTASLRLEEASRMVVDEINLARQVASSRNERVQVRFIRVARGGETAFWQVQSGTLSRRDETFTPLKEVGRLPLGVVMSAQAALSPVLSAPRLSNQTPTYTFCQITIRPSGEVESIGIPMTTQNWFITLLSERDEEKPFNEVANFVTVQMDPLTARIRTYRP